MSLKISNNYIVDSAYLYFYYEDSTQINQVKPSEGYIEGGNVVSVIGNFSLFWDQPFDLYFGSQLITNYTLKSPSKISLIIPPVLVQQEVNIIFKYENLIYNNETIYYSYKTYSDLSIINPNFGPTSGGTLIEVTGQRFDDQAYCLIDDILVRPIIINSTKMLCEAPRHKEASGLVFELQFNDAVYQTKTGISYSYYNDIQINSLDPSYISMYAQNNQVIVNVYGYGFKDTPLLMVRMNGQKIKPTYISSKHLTFPAPNVLYDGTYFVFVSNNGKDFQRGSSNVVLTYYKLLGVMSLSITKVQIGDQLTIKAYGYNFPTTGTFYCVFGRPNIPPNLQYNIKAYLNTSTQLSCDIPTYGGVLTTLTAIDFRVSYNLQEFYGDLKLWYFPPIALYYFNDTSIIQSQSQIVLTLTGENFINTADELTCKLETDDRSFSLKAFNILYLSDTQIICSFEMLDSGYYDLYVSNNNLQFAWAPVQLEILDSIQVLDADPVILMSQKTNQYITVKANNLLPNSSCLFEISNSDNAYIDLPRDIVVGNIISSDIIVCKVPDYSGVGTANVNLRIAYGPDPLKTQSKSSILLKFVDRCPPGYACQNLQIVRCPKGYYCTGGAMTQMAKPCPIGYFQDKELSDDCKPCPKGFTCPQSGLEEPIPCEEGYICEIEKSNSPNQQCPKGYYCEQGTQSADIYDLSYLTVLPNKCSQGIYCREGMRTGIAVEQNADSSTPSYCKQGMICYEGSQDVGGVGACPGGYFCPTYDSTGIICPPRHYCPDRGNKRPIRCPRGTFNMHFGQKNCTICTLGRYCPIEGLFLPLLCPPGYACNQEGLTFPDNLCKVGHICLGGVMTATAVKKRSCYMSVSIGGLNPCVYGSLYKADQQGQFSAQKFYTYFYNLDVCCMNGTEVSNYVSAIGQNHNSVDAFKSYAYMINSTGTGVGIYFKHHWNGMRIVDKAAFSNRFNTSDKLFIPVKKHRDLLINYFQLMYTKYQQQLCPGGYLCLEGVYTFTADNYLISTPFPCPLGSYCLKGSDSVIGSGLCPIGFFCPAQTEFPKPADSGFYTGSQGAVEAQQCQPGTFALGTKSAFCTQCPNGYQCKDKGTSTPSICPTGFYRSITESNVCSACPKGTFSFERGIRDILECLECPPGRICENEAYTNITSSIPCTDGQVCSSGSGAKGTQPCPEGFYCSPETTEDSQYDNQCEAGFFCKVGTGFSTKTRDTCPQTYFCPPGTGEIIIKEKNDDYSTWATDPPTRCPEGTGGDGTDTRTSIQQCYINSDFKLLDSDLSVRISETSGQNTNSDSNSQSSSARLLFESYPSRNLATTILSKDSDLLKDLYEIDYLIGDFYDNYVEGTVIPPTSETQINYQRQYITRWCPLNITLVSDYVEIEELSEDALESHVPNVIFELPPSAYALITMDLRHLRDESFEWTYGEDYQISFTMDPDLTIDDPSFPIPMPEQFLYNGTDKSQVLEFMVFALDQVRLRIDILLYNALYLNYKYLFVNSTSVEIRYPNRANYGTQNTFITSLVYDYQISLPLNVPKLMPDRDEMPTNLVSFANSQDNWDPIRHRQTKNRNIFIPASLYWGDRDRINLPYLPFLSNCKGYGKYIPFWALMEQHYTCSLIPQNETVWMTEYSFGLKPTADTCDEVVINCIYDEIFDTKQPLQRWFEIESETPLFDITIDPALYADMVGADFESTEILNVFPEYDGDFSGLVPKTIQLTLSYYQVDQNLKRIILPELVYDQFEELSDDEGAGLVKVEYQFIFSFQPLSHKDLTINFAFSWTFYVVLYLLVGMIAVINVLIFLIYHRFAIRPKQGKTLAKFKFWSYINLIIRPALYGMTLVMIPLILGNFFISAFIVAHVFQIDTSLYSCNDPGGPSNCVMTLFDHIKDNPTNSLRTGRLGTTMLVMGAYLLYVSLTILVPDKTDQVKIKQMQHNQRKVPEAFDGNTWEYYQWKRSNMVFVSTFLLFFELAIIQFSFSPSYGDNNWVMIGVMKVVQIIVENVIERSLSEALLVSPLSVSIGVMQGLITFGASNFLDFLNGFFIEIGIQMFERPYLEPIVEVVQTYIEEKIPLVYASLRKWVKNEDELADKTTPVALAPENQEGTTANNPAPAQQNNGSPRKEQLMFEGDSQESSRSEIYYSEDSSFNSRGDEDGFDDNPNIYLFNQGDLNQSEIASVDLSKEIKDLKGKIKKKKEDEIKGNTKKEENEDDEEKEDEDEFEDFDEYQHRKNDSANESDIKLDQDVEAQLVEPLIESYVGYANDTLSLLYQPFFTALLWIFYDETIVASLYGIRIQDFVYYFLFNIVIIPFQITIDIFFHNIIEWYHDIPVHDYLDYLAYRFKTRKSRWKGNESTTNIYIAESLRSLDQLCFSSQYFFVVTLYAGGLTQILLGIQILLWEKQYNIFADFGTIPLVLFMLSLCILVHRICLLIGQIFKIWKIDETMEKLEKKDEDLTISQMFARILDPEKFKQVTNLNRQFDDVYFDPKQWRLIDRIKLEEEQNKNELMTDRIIAQTFRDMFMKYNKPWIREQLYEVFTPRTLFVERQQIIEQFKKVLGDIQPDVSIESENSNDSKKNNTDSLLLDSREFDKKVFKKKKKFVPTQEEINWVQQNNKPTVRAIIKYWILRARLKQKVRIQVNKIIESHIQKICVYCKSSFGLKVELIQNIEDIFFDFLKYKKADIVSYNAMQWQSYFRKHATFRTLCLDCSTAIEDYHRRVRNAFRDRELRNMKKALGIEKGNKQDGGEDSDEDDVEDKRDKDDSIGLEKRKNKIRSISQNAKIIIRNMILMARENIRKRRQLKRR